MRGLFGLLVCLLFAGSAAGRIITVDDDGPADFNKIQAAIDDVNDGDVVEIQPGIYTGDGNRDIDFLGKAILVRSTNPKDPAIVAATVVDCNGTEADQHRGFHFHSGEDRDSVLDGLTIIHGYFNTWPYEGGAILCNKASPKIINCIIRDNRASYGGGIHCRDAHDVMIIDCTIVGNTCQQSGGGIGIIKSSVLLSGCAVYKNAAIDEYASGAGIFCGSSEFTASDCLVFDNLSSYRGGGLGCSYSSVTLNNCTIVGNSGKRAGGISFHGYDLSGTMSNCIVWNNRAEYGAHISVDMGYTISIGHSNIQGGLLEIATTSLVTVNWGPGNIDVNPGFANLEAGDYHLSSDSPCIDRGDPDYMPFSGEADIDGHERIIGGRVDIGADEFGSTAVPILEVWPGNLEYYVYEDYGNPPVQFLAIQNRGAGPMNWSITACPWLEISPPNGQCADEIDYVEVSADVHGLPDGIHNCQLVVDGDGAIGGHQIIDVNLIIHGPEIELSATQLEFTAIEGREDPPEKSFLVRNVGGATLDWCIDANANWLEVTPKTGSSRGEATEVKLSVDISALTWGYYHCDVVVTDGNAINNPQNVSVDLHVFVGEAVKVPAYVPTIQDGIDHALEGGTVVVADGVYTGEGNRDIDFKGKAITVRSENGPGNCIIDCGGRTDSALHRGFFFHSREDGNSVVSGFTITNGWAYTDCWYGSGGGAIMCLSSSPTISNCVLTNNSVMIACIVGDSTGGAIYLGESDSIIKNCIIIGNTVFGGAGGIHSQPDSNPIISHCTICDNHGVGILGVGLSVTNSILWGNGSGYSWESFSDQLIVDRGSAVVNFSNIQGGWLGLGNIAEDPCFVSPGYWDAFNPPWDGGYNWVDGGYHLQSEGWRWDSQRGVWTWDDVTSRCIDAGDPDSPLGGEPLGVVADPNNDWGRNVRINMGAYGGTPQASMGPNGWAIRKDYNNDGIVNFTDMACWSDNYVYSHSKRIGRNADANDLSHLAQCWLDTTSWFETACSVPPHLPGKATDPDPPDRDTRVSKYFDPGWRADPYAESHDVYFGTTNPPPFLGNQTSPRLGLGANLQEGTTYYWRIDEINALGKTTGDLWTFTTRSY